MQKLTQATLKSVREQITLGQGNRCALCGVSFTDAKQVKGKLVRKYTPAVDHDHKTGAIRGVLCLACNRAEGQIKNKATTAKKDLTVLEWLTRLVDYLTKHETPQTPYMYPTHKTDDEKRLATNKKARMKRAREKAAKILKGK